jgi:hypothetical protein
MFVENKPDDGTEYLYISCSEHLSGITADRVVKVGNYERLPDYEHVVSLANMSVFAKRENDKVD